MTNDEAAEIKHYIKSLFRATRMEYAQAMTLEGLNDDLIINVQQRVAKGMIDWVQTT
jgi:hypothetical protein